MKNDDDGMYDPMRTFIHTYIHTNIRQRGRTKVGWINDCVVSFGMDEGMVRGGREKGKVKEEKNKGLKKMTSNNDRS